MSRSLRTAWRTVLGLMLVTACSGEPSPPLSVAAASSLTDVLEPIAARFERETGRAVALRFGASSTLARQIQDGAPTDVFVSADPRWVNELSAVAHPRSRRTFAANHLVVVVPRDAAETPTDLAALVALDHLAVAGAEVPAGAHARLALQRADLFTAIEPHLVSAPNVRAALAWVASGEADAGLVYATDARVEDRVRLAFALPPAADDPIVYEAVAIGTSESAAAFVAFLAGPEARPFLDDAGFGAAP